MKRDTKLIAILSDQDDFEMLVLEDNIGPYWSAVLRGSSQYRIFSQLAGNFDILK